MKQLLPLQHLIVLDTMHQFRRKKLHKEPSFELSGTPDGLLVHFRLHTRKNVFLRNRNNFTKYSCPINSKSKEATHQNGNEKHIEVANGQMAGEDGFYGFKTNLSKKKIRGYCALNSLKI